MSAPIQLNDFQAFDAPVVDYFHRHALVFAKLER